MSKNSSDNKKDNEKDNEKDKSKKKFMCSVCADELVMRKKITCRFCNYDACMNCIKRYLLSSDKTVHCMSCNKPWNIDFLKEVMPKFAEYEYEDHHTTLMLNREKSLLPEAQILLEQKLKVNKIKKDIIELKKEYNKSLGILHEKLNKLQQGKVDEKRKFIHSCPEEDCNGFLSTRWKCGLCDCEVCPDCHEIKVPSGTDQKEKKDLRDEHECNKDNVETVKLMSKEVKNCPKCSASIYKIEGCDQMFCTSCKTTFSWKTLKIETRVFHNPHYYEWKRSQEGKDIPRQPGDILCGGLPNYNLLINNIKKESKETAKIVAEAYRLVGHYTDTIRNAEEPNNMDLRFRFLQKDISEKKWKNLLLQRKKKYERTKAYNEILQTYTTITTDILQKMSTQFSVKDDKKICIVALRELNELRDYCNKEIDKVLIKFKSKAYKQMPHITYDAAKYIVI